MNLLNDMRVLLKIASTFAVLIVASLVISVVSWLSTSTLQQTSTMTIHTYEVLDRLNASVADMVNQETGLRGFLLAGDPKFLEPFQAGLAKFAENLKATRELTSDNTAQQVRLGEFETSAKQWTAGAQKAIALMKNPQTVDAARQIEISGAGKASFDALRAKAADIGNEESKLLGARAASAASAAFTSQLAIILGGVAMIVIAGLSLLLMNRALVKPIKSLTDAMSAIARGATNVVITGTERGDEIGAMARAFDENAVRIAKLAQTELEREAAAVIERKQAMLALAERFENSVGGVVKIVSQASTELQATAQQLTASAQETSAQSTAVSAASEQAGANVTTVASSAEELGASVNEIGRQVELSTQKSRAAVGEADATAKIMSDLTEATSQIGAIVELISGIASQTNLLALNATIEAARAGEAGRGFAVVAQEVKMLAEQTAKATSDIGQQIAGIQATTGKAVTAIRGISDTIRVIDDTSAAISAAVEQQGAATREIVHAMAQTAGVTAEVSHNIGGVARAAEETGAGAAQVLDSSSNLSRQAEMLNEEVATFLATVRAA